MGYLSTMEEDLPVKLDELNRGFQIQSGDSPPGFNSVRHRPGKHAEWYCQVCYKFISPLWVRQGEVVFPTCPECFVDELAQKEEDENIAVLEDAEAGTSIPEQLL